MKTPNAEELERPRPLGWLASLGLVLVAAGWRQAGAVRVPFLADDYLFLDQVRGRALLSALLSRDPLENYVRPVGRQFYFWVVDSLGATPVVAHAINTGAFLLIVALVFVITRRLTCTRAATIGSAFVALHYAADVPVRWASGSQDLLATVGALGAVLLFMSGRRWASAVVLLLALLSKETVVLTPVVAMLVTRRQGETWRRTAARSWPLFAVVGVWAASWFLTIHRGAVEQLSTNPESLLAAIAHLPQVILGAEWRPHWRMPFLDSPTSLGPVVLALVAAALAPPGLWLANGGDLGAAAPATAGQTHVFGMRSAVVIGSIWAVAGALPVTAVAPVWNAYYYLFALCGAALVLGALLARSLRALAMAVLLALAWGSENGRRLDQFATGPGVWNTQSHLNRFYFDRAMFYVNRCLQTLRRAHPALPRNSTMLFSNVAPMVAWQGGDGALLRWAYRDSTLRSYYISAFSLEVTRRGPVFVFDTQGDTLEDITWHPQLYMEIALSLLTAGHVAGACDALTMELLRHPGNATAKYWKGWAMYARGDTAGALLLLTESGCLLQKGPSPELRDAEMRLALGDTVGAEARIKKALMHYVLDSRVHAAWAHLELLHRPLTPGTAIEAFAARLLAPEDQQSWRRWAFVQYSWGNYEAAYESLERYFSLAGPGSRGDHAAVGLANALRRSLPGGDLAQEALRR